MIKRAKKFDYKNWLKEIVHDKECYVQYKNEEDKEVSDSFREQFYIYTHDNKYKITVAWRKGNNGYLGCVVSCRKPRAGEDWTRGNDLPDGPYSYETWQKIKNGILKYELVKVAKKRGIVNIEEIACGKTE